MQAPEAAPPSDGPRFAEAVDALDSPRRLASLAATRLMDSEAEEVFDRLTRLASDVLGAPIGAVTLLDAERQFIKSSVGLGEPLATMRACPVGDSFCQHAVRSRAAFVVEDARTHPLVKESPFVASGMLSYAGIPIHNGGEALGTFYVADHKPRVWTERELAILRDLGATIESQIAAHVVVAEAERRKALLETVLDSMGSGLVVCDADRRPQIMNAEARRLLVDPSPAKLGLYRADGTTPFKPDELPLSRAIAGHRTDDLDAVICPSSRTDVPPTPVSVTARPLPTGGAVMILHDTTTTRELERKARLSDTLYHRLAGNIPNARSRTTRTTTSPYRATNGTFARSSANSTTRAPASTGSPSASAAPSSTPLHRVRSNSSSTPPTPRCTPPNAHARIAAASPSPRPPARPESMSFSPAMIKKAIGPHSIQGADARRVVEIACLAVAADGNLEPEELHVIRALCKELDVDIRTVDEVLALGSREDRLERLRAVGAAVSSTEAKHLAYKMTVLSAVADLAAADEEFEFDLDVQDALGLDSADADRLAGEVHEALTPDAT